ncbi:MAG: hypothetical protein JKX68_02740 [Flavobacteriales bacterium]|nr:hypothetical protein [Flavobacteriales bacterium]
MMKKSIFLLILLTIIGNGIYAQSADQNSSTATPEQNRLEATIICLDAIEAPTKYNAFAKQFIDAPSLPKKTNTISQDGYRKEINDWLISNPLMVGKILTERKKAHDILYGPRPY